MATQPMQQSQHSFISSPNVPALHSSPIAPNDIKEEPQPEPGPRATNPATGGTTSCRTATDHSRTFSCSSRAFSPFY